MNIYLDSQIRNLTSDLELAREQLDEEQEAKSELQKQVSRLTAEVQQWRSRFESEGKVLYVYKSIYFNKRIYYIIIKVLLVVKNLKMLNENYLLN